MSSQSVRITDLEKQLSEAKNELKTVKDELAGYAGDSGSVNMYAGLIDAVSYYLDDDFDNAMVELAKIDVTKLPTDKAKSLYTLLDENCNSGAETYLKAGSNAYDKSDYITLILNRMRRFIILQCPISGLMKMTRVRNMPIF